MQSKKHHKTHDGHIEYHNRARIRNYKKGREYQTIQRLWYPAEVARLYYRDNEGILCDRDIAKELSRSVQSVQNKRYLLNRAGNPITQSVQIVLDYFIEHGLGLKSE